MADFRPSGRVKIQPGQPGVLTYRIEMTSGLERFARALCELDAKPPGAAMDGKRTPMGAMRTAMTGNPFVESFDLSVAQRNYTGRNSAEACRMGLLEIAAGPKFTE